MLAVTIGFLISFALIFLQVPIATALGLVGFGGVVWLNGWTPALSMAATITRDTTLVYSLIVLPLFGLPGAGAGQRRTRADGRKGPVPHLVAGGRHLRHRHGRHLWRAVHLCRGLGHRCLGSAAVRALAPQPHLRQDSRYLCGQRTHLGDDVRHHSRRGAVR